MSNLKQISPEDIDLLPYPVYFLDENRIFVRRNKTAGPKRIAIRMRAKLDRYISNRDRQRVMELPVGEEIFVDLFFDSVFGAAILRLENGYLLALRNVTAHMMRYVSNLAIRIPTFFCNVEGQIENLRLANIKSQTEMQRVRHQYYKVVRYQMCMAQYFESTSGNYKRDRISEIVTPIKLLLETAVKKLRPNGINVSIRLQDQPTFVQASADDVRYAAATLLSIAAENTFDGRIRVESRTVEKNYLLKISFEPNVDDLTYEGMLAGYYSGDLLQSVHGNVFFDLLLVQMLAEGSCWNFSVQEEGCSRGVIGLCLYIPISEAEPLLLNSPVDSSTLLDAMLVNVLGPQYNEETSTL